MGPIVMRVPPTLLCLPPRMLLFAARSLVSLPSTLRFAELEEASLALLDPEPSLPFVLLPVPDLRLGASRMSPPFLPILPGESLDVVVAVCKRFIVGKKEKFKAKLICLVFKCCCDCM